MLRRQKRTCVEPAQQHRLEQSKDEGFPCGCRSLVTGQCHKGNSYISEKLISRTFRKDHGSWHRCYSQVWPWTPIVYTGLVFSVDGKKKKKEQEKHTAEITQTKRKPWVDWVMCLAKGTGNYNKNTWRPYAAPGAICTSSPVNYSFPKPPGCGCGLLELKGAKVPRPREIRALVRSTLGGQAVSRVGHCGGLRSRLKDCVFLFYNL